MQGDSVGTYHGCKAKKRNVQLCSIVQFTLATCFIFGSTIEMLWEKAKKHLKYRTNLLVVKGPRSVYYTRLYTFTN